MIEDGAGPKWQNFSAFTWLPGELHVFFAPYQVGPYSAGQQEVRIPLAKLQGLIRPDWRAPPPQQAQASPSAQPISQSAASPLPSFDCTKAATFIEKEICRDPALAKLDAALSQNWTAMNAANIGSSAKHDLLVTQRVWLSSRDQCTDNTCLRAAYRKRIDAICDYPVIAGVHPDCVMADSIANADASPLSPPIAARDWKLALNENGAIITSQALGTTVYLGKSCDAQSPQYGTGHWQWNDAGWEVDVGNQRLAFPRGKPPISPPEDAPTKCKSE